MGKPQEPEYPKGEPISISPPNVQTPDQVIGAAQPRQRPEATVAQPVKSGEVPSPVFRRCPRGEPVVPPAIQRAREFAAKKAAQMYKAAAQEEERKQAETQAQAPIPFPSASQAEQAASLPWEEEENTRSSVESVGQGRRGVPCSPFRPASYEPEGESSQMPEESFPQMLNQLPSLFWWG